MLIDKKSKFYQELGKFEDFYIFGTGFAGELEYLYLNNKKIIPTCFVVSGDYDYPKELCGISVRRFDEISDDNKKKVAVMIGRPEYKNEESIQILKKAGFKHVFPGGSQWYREDDEELISKMKKAYNVRDVIDEIYSDEKQVGDDRLMVYACVSDVHYHEVSEKWKSNNITYVQGGAAIADKRICELGDDTGINISAKNPYYNELTVGYWAAKNDKIHDIIGLYHYSRGFNINMENVGKYFDAGIDAILPQPHCFFWGVNSYTSYTEQVYLRQAIEKKTPEYMDCFRSFFKGNYFCESSIIITRREIYCDFYEWMFDLFEDIEKFLDENKLWTPRLTAYIAEHMFNIYFLKHRYKYNIAFSTIRSLYSYD